ncbi:unnamed protein product [Ceutorhynchus assimilis]|uniref:Uncharacterized protein n=1 Tax=Ceutorhynchus assimilis TaxID=467358 RepID=A0A9N9N1B0_9CUCU|nr:unnamed protein product [Ceutorhynchus assimilis]
MQKVHFLLLVVLTTVAVCSGGQVSKAEASICKEEDCKPCTPSIECPEGTEEGYAFPCQCCPSCVIREGGKCPWMGEEPDSGEVECEVDTNCCNDVCSREECETDTTTESSTTTDAE